MGKKVTEAELREAVMDLRQAEESYRIAKDLVVMNQKKALRLIKRASNQTVKAVMNGELGRKLV